jgi:hypothetical protein
MENGEKWHVVKEEAPEIEKEKQEPQESNADKEGGNSESAEMKRKEMHENYPLASKLLSNYKKFFEDDSATDNLSDEDLMKVRAAFDGGDTNPLNNLLGFKIKRLKALESERDLGIRLGRKYRIIEAVRGELVGIDKNVFNFEEVQDTKENPEEKTLSEKYPKLNLDKENVGKVFLDFLEKEKIAELKKAPSHEGKEVTGFAGRALEYEWLDESKEKELLEKIAGEEVKEEDMEELRKNVQEIVEEQFVKTDLGLEDLNINIRNIKPGVEEEKVEEPVEKPLDEIAKEELEKRITDMNASLDEFMKETDEDIDLIKVVEILDKMLEIQDFLEKNKEDKIDPDELKGLEEKFGIVKEGAKIRLSSMEKSWDDLKLETDNFIKGEGSKEDKIKKIDDSIGVLETSLIIVEKCEKLGIAEAKKMRELLEYLNEQKKNLENPETYEDKLEAIRAETAENLETVLTEADKTISDMDKEMTNISGQIAELAKKGENMTPDEKIALENLKKQQNDAKEQLENLRGRRQEVSKDNVASVALPGTMLVRKGFESGLAFRKGNEKPMSLDEVAAIAGLSTALKNLAEVQGLELEKKIVTFSSDSPEAAQAGRKVSRVMGENFASENEAGWEGEGDMFIISEAAFKTLLDGQTNLEDMKEWTKMFLERIGYPEFQDLEVKQAEMQNFSGNAVDENAKKAEIKATLGKSGAEKSVTLVFEIVPETKDNYIAEHPKEVIEEGKQPARFTIISEEKETAGEEELKDKQIMEWKVSDHGEFEVPVDNATFIILNHSKRGKEDVSSTDMFGTDRQLLKKFLSLIKKGEDKEYNDLYKGKEQIDEHEELYKEIIESNPSFIRNDAVLKKNEGLTDKEGYFAVEWTGKDQLKKKIIFIAEFRGQKEKGHIMGFLSGKKNIGIKFREETEAEKTDEDVRASEQNTEIIAPERMEKTVDFLRKNQKEQDFIPFYKAIEIAKEDENISEVLENTYIHDLVPKIFKKSFREASGIDVDNVSVKYFRELLEKIKEEPKQETQRKDWDTCKLSKESLLEIEPLSFPGQRDNDGKAAKSFLIETKIRTPKELENVDTIKVTKKQDAKEPKTIIELSFFEQIKGGSEQATKNNKPIKLIVDFNEVDFRNGKDKQEIYIKDISK